MDTKLLIRLVDDVIVAVGDYTLLPERNQYRAPGIFGGINARGVGISDTVTLPTAIIGTETVIEKINDLLVRKYKYTTIGGFEENVDYEEPFTQIQAMRKIFDIVKIIKDRQEIIYQDIQDIKTHLGI